MKDKNAKKVPRNAISRWEGEGGARRSDEGAVSEVASKQSDRRTAERKRPDANKETTAGRSGGIVDAPGKQHRLRAPSTRGVKHSDQTISKITGAKTMRRGQRRG
jgi:hypothetical protein